MSLLLLFRPLAGEGPPPEPEVVTPPAPHFIDDRQIRRRELFFRIETPMGDSLRRKGQS